MRTSFGSLLLAIPLLAVGCVQPPEAVEEAPPVDLVAEEAEAKTVVDLWLESWVEEDISLMDRAFAHDSDMVIFGTDAAEYWVGYDAARASLEFQISVFEDLEGVNRNQDIKVHSSGQVAWFTQMIDWGITSGGERIEMTAWFSGVLEKRAGAWKIVQLHASVPVAGQAVAY
ncbi:MAG: nuclear transport factor 2 family protein [Longimicrobiales bacterium]|nr:nuclear transport factor 2 family protein [Longimicrobiales bacterium]